MAVTLAQIKADQLQARKSKNELATKLLTTLIGEVEGELTRLDPAQRAAKEGDVAQATVKSFLKKNREAQEYMSKSEIHPAAVEQNLADLRAEATLLEAYLPTQLTEAQLEEIFRAEFPDGITAKEKGKAMAILKANYNGQYDGKLASDVLGKLIA
jgi:uncharacterized protein YqeY